MWKQVCVISLVVCWCHLTVGLSDELINEIKSHQDAVDQIIDYVTKGAGKHVAWKRLANLTDTFGPRPTGSQALEDAIDYCRDELEDEGFTVQEESVEADEWVRNEESARILMPFEHRMNMMSLGSSVGGSVTAFVEVVNNVEELHAKYKQNASVFEGKIVVYSMSWDGYSSTRVYRSNGASWASLYGARAALIRSVTQFSIDSPHTGQQTYFPNVTNKIPIAAITVEDAQLIARYRQRGVPVQVELIMNCENKGTITTRNLISDWTGTTKDDEYVIIGGHIDSWDVGFGVMDDGGGVMISWMALSIMKELNLTPKRTVRSVFWSAEEIGLVGGYKFYDDHKIEKDKISILMESDYGTFKPLGIGFSGKSEDKEIMEEIMKLLQRIDATGVQDGGTSPDTGMWQPDTDVPLGNLWTANDKYFYFHHTDGDSMTMEDPDDLDLCTIVWTSVAYVVANLENKLPRTDTLSVNAAFSPTSSFMVLLICSMMILMFSKRQ